VPIKRVTSVATCIVLIESLSFLWCDRHRIEARAVLVRLSPVRNQRIFRGGTLADHSSKGVKLKKKGPIDLSHTVDARVFASSLSDLGELTIGT
jgi:hypothetical protein